MKKRRIFLHEKIECEVPVIVCNYSYKKIEILNKKLSEMNFRQNFRFLSFHEKS